MWDYHVIVLVKDEGSYMVYDLDIAPKHTPLELAVPCDINTYAATVLSPTTLWPPRRYRIVPAEIFFKHFASDRSHMLTGPSETEQPRPAVRTPQYVAPPPPYPPIVAPDGSTHTLDCYLNMSSNGMEESDRFGIILDEQSFLRWVSE